MVRGIADARRQCFEVRQILIALDQPDRRHHRLAIAADLVGLAPQARAIPRRARALPVGEILNIVAQGMTRGA